MGHRFSCVVGPKCLRSRDRPHLLGMVHLREGKWENTKSSWKLIYTHTPPQHLPLTPRARLTLTTSRPTSTGSRLTLTRLRTRRPISFILRRSYRPSWCQTGLTKTHGPTENTRMGSTLQTDTGRWSGVTSSRLGVEVRCYLGGPKSPLRTETYFLWYLTR